MCALVSNYHLPPVSAGQKLTYTEKEFGLMLLNDQTISLPAGGELTITEADQRWCEQGRICNALKGNLRTILAKLSLSALHPFWSIIFLNTVKPIKVSFGNDNRSYTLIATADLVISRSVAIRNLTKHNIDEAVKSRNIPEFSTMNGRQVIHFSDLDAADFLPSEVVDEAKKTDKIVKALNRHLPSSHSFNLAFEGSLLAYPHDLKDPSKGLVIGATNRLTLTIIPTKMI